MSGYRSPWAILGIGETDDERAVKRAYSAKLKEMDVEADPQGFIALRAAFDQARNIAIWRTEQKAEAERREAEGLDDSSLDQDWEDEDWDDDWQSGPPPAAYAHERQSAAAETNGPAATHPKIDGVEIDLSLADGALIVSPFAAPRITATNVSLADGLSAKLAEPPNADQETSDYYGPAFQGLSNVIALHIVPTSEKAGSGALPLALPTQPLPQIFPDRTPLYASFFGYGKRTKPAASDLPTLDAFADLESEEAEAGPSQVEAKDIGDAADSDAADTQVWPSAIDLDTSGYVSFTRDDWGNADRERIAQLLYDRHFGPAEASEVERLANRLFASPHMDELDYRDWIENWCANLISETSPRSDGMLVLASKVFGWGTDADKLYHDYAVGRCVARNRDLDAIRQMQDPDNRWHPQYTLLQQPAPASISWWSRRKWQEVQTFIDNVRANRPTVEWDLDPEHVALWDKLIDARRGGYSESNTSPGLQWYHYLIFAFMILQLIVRGFGGFSSKAEADLPYYQQEAGQSADKPEIVDYTDRARIAGDKATEEQRQRLAPQFNQIIREPTSTLHLTASKLEPTFDLSRYVETTDLAAMVEGSCDFDCKTRIKQQLDNVAEGTTQVGDMSVKVKPAPAPKPLSNAELTRIADNIRTGKFSNLTSGLTEEDLEKVKQKVGAAAPPAPPKPKNVSVKIPLEWTFSPDDPNQAPTVKRNDGMKKLGFTAADIDALGQSMVRNDLPDGKFEWECAKKCDAIINKVINRQPQ